MVILKTLITFLYLCTGIISIIAYFPTIRDLNKKIASANISSYFLWTLTTGVSFLYALIIISDILLIIITGLSFVCCMTILTLVFKLK